MLAGKRLRRLTWPDVLLLVGLVALPVWSLVQARHTVNGPAAAYVFEADRLQGVYPLNRSQTVRVSGPDGGHVLIEIAEGRVRVAESSCPEQLCVRTGWVTRPGRPIVCLPNKVLVEVRRAATKSDVDAESH